MGEGDVAPLSEVHEVDGEHDCGRQHAKRGEGMGGDGSVCTRARR
jgi:hypothetical protein